MMAQAIRRVWTEEEYGVGQNEDYLPDMLRAFPELRSLAFCGLTSYQFVGAVHHLLKEAPFLREFTVCEGDDDEDPRRVRKAYKKVRVRLQTPPHPVLAKMRLANSALRDLLRNSLPLAENMLKVRPRLLGGETATRTKETNGGSRKHR